MQGAALLRGHRRFAVGVAFAPDGKALATGDTEGTVHLWSLAPRGGYVSLGGAGRGGLNSLDIAADGRTMAVASDDGTVHLWDTQAGKELARLRGHADKVNRAAFAPDGKTLASASDDRTARLWDVVTAKERAVLRSHQGPVNDAVFSPDGKTLATGADAKHDTVRVWDVATGEVRGRVAIFGRTTEPVAGMLMFLPDGRALLLGVSGAGTRFWEVATGTELTHLSNALRGGEEVVGFSKDGKSLALAHGDGTVRLLDAMTLREKARIVDRESVVSAVALSPDGTRAASQSEDGTLKLWDVTMGRELGRLPSEGQGRRTAFALDRRVLAWVTGSAVRLLRLDDKPPPPRQHLKEILARAKLKLDGVTLVDDVEALTRGGGPASGPASAPRPATQRAGGR